jgi:hypothetical protein
MYGYFSHACLFLLHDKDHVFGVGVGDGIHRDVKASWNGMEQKTDGDQIAGA